MTNAHQNLKHTYLKKHMSCKIQKRLRYTKNLQISFGKSLFLTLPPPCENVHALLMNT